jgi:hypothetical protein
MTLAHPHSPCISRCRGKVSERFILDNFPVKPTEVRIILTQIDKRLGPEAMGKEDWNLAMERLGLRAGH